MQRHADTKADSAGSSPAPSTLVAFDTETHLIQPGLLAPPLVCGSFAPRADSAYLFDPGQARATFKWHLGQPDTIVGANVAYDMGVMAALDPSLLSAIFDKYERGQVYDVQIAQALHRIAQGQFLVDPTTGRPYGKGRYSLDRCVRECLGRDDAKRNDFWRTRYALLEHLDVAQWPEDARQYPLDDARNTLEVALAQHNHRNVNRHVQEVRAALIMHLGAVWGLRTDPERVAALSAEVEASHAERVIKYRALGWIREDESKDMAAIRAAVERAYSGDPPRTDKGAVKTDRDTLTESGDDDLADFADAEDEKIRTTYIPFLEQGLRHPLNLRPNVLVSSFRASYDGVIQQMPRSGKARGCFKARPGYVYCSCDYGQLEMATLAQVHLWMFNRSALADMIRAGKDPLTNYAAVIRSCSYDEGATRKAAKEPVLTKTRQAGKPIVYGIGGGMGDAKIVQWARTQKIRFCQLLEGLEPCGTQKITEYKGRHVPPVCKRCVELVRDVLRPAYMQMVPEMPAYFAFVSHLADTAGEITLPTPDGIGVTRGGVSFTDGANGYFQGLAALGAKHALWLVGRECWVDRGTALFGTRPIFFVHDEIFAEVPEEVAHETGYRMADLMMQGMLEYVPDVPVKVEPALMRWWDKEAGTATRNGRLIPWEERDAG